MCRACGKRSENYRRSAELARFALRRAGGVIRQETIAFAPTCNEEVANRVRVMLADRESRMLRQVKRQVTNEGKTVLVGASRWKAINIVSAGQDD